MDVTHIQAFDKFHHSCLAQRETHMKGHCPRGGNEGPRLAYESTTSKLKDTSAKDTAYRQTEYPNHHGSDRLVVLRMKYYLITE